jgi:D-threonate/D-erythronate kinase
VIALVADDLTGASDAAVQFARRGLVSHVLFELGEPGGAEVVAIDTDSRALPGADAYARVRGVADRLRATRPERIYKKIDSTLRGNLGCEIDAVMDGLDLPLAVVAPAFPALGRTTRGGVHHLRGTPVHLTEAGRDPRVPVRQSNLVRLLAQQSRRPVTLVPLAVVQEGPDAVRRALPARGLVVCDADTDDALRTITGSLVDRRDVLWVGSAGLAEALAELLAPAAPRAPAAGPGPAAGPVLLVAASPSEVTRRQVAVYAARPDVTTVALDPRALAEGGAGLEAGRRALGSALAAGRHGALVARAPPARADPVSGGELAARIADALGALAAACARSYPLGGLILTGGDTARAVCRHLGATGVHVVAEIEPGVPAGRLLGGAGLPAVTKAGAFGSDDTLVHALDQLTGGQSPCPVQSR